MPAYDSLVGGPNHANLEQGNFTPESPTKDMLAGTKALYYEEGILEIDDGAQVSRTEEGAYVLGWVWISESDVQSK